MSAAPASLARYPADHTRPSLIRSLIRLRPEPFGVHHLEQAAQVADRPDLRRTQARRLESVLGDDSGVGPCVVHSVNSVGHATARMHGRRHC